MKRKGRTLQRPYQAALRRYIEKGTAANVRPARELGRQAVSLGLAALDLALIHEQALLSAVDAASNGRLPSRASIVERAGRFFAEAILPMEERRRTTRKATGRLRKMNGALGRRIKDLPVYNQRLQREIAKRRSVQESLRKSKERFHSLLEQSRHTQAQLRLLSRRVLSVQEEERRTVSRELHDVIAQMLTGIHVRLGALKKEAAANTRGLSQKISRTQRLVEKSVDVVHRFARELRPAMLDDLGLIPAVHAFLKGFMAETGIRVHLAASTDVEKLSSIKRTALYRVAQEALANVARHAQASRVDVSIQKLPNAVRMKIQDDGKSFDVLRMWGARRSRHLGMLGMKERVEMVRGTFAVESAPGQGTTIMARIPFDAGVRERSRP